MLSKIKKDWLLSLPLTYRHYAEGLELVDKDIGGEAQQHGNTIWIGSKFFDLDENVRNWVLTHELGHWYREQFISLEDIMPWNNPVFGNLDITNGQAEEDFAECFVSYLMAPREFHSKHPEAFDLIKQVLEEGYLKRAMKILAQVTDEESPLYNVEGIPYNKICYHGTSVESLDDFFSEFDLGYSDYDAIWVSPEEKDAEKFTLWHQYGQTDIEIVFKVDVNLENALQIDMSYAWLQ